MTKKKVWIAGNIVLVLLLLCTVLSFRVEKLMRNEAEIVTPIQSEEEKNAQEAKIPLACYQADDSSSAFFYLEEREGLFGPETVAVRQENWPLREEGDMAVINDSQGKNDSDRWFRIVETSVYPMKDGEVVKVGITENPGEKLGKQKNLLICLAAMIPVSLLVFGIGVKMLGALQGGNKKKGIVGAGMILVWLGVLYYVTGLVDIPRIYLPPEQILDIGFYLR